MRVTSGGNGRASGEGKSIEKLRKKRKREKKEEFGNGE